MQGTSISWCDWTWNPTRGCSRISPGCVNCYAEKIAARFSRHVMDSDGIGTYTVEPFHGFAEYRTIGGKREAHWTGKVELIESKLLEPLSWRKKAVKFAAKHGHRPRCFVNSMSDLFHEALPDAAIDRVFAVMALCPEIDFLCLTKRAKRMAEYMSTPIDQGRRVKLGWDGESEPPRWGAAIWTHSASWPLPNAWLGVSVEDQKRADERIPHLLRTPAAVRFLSCEPLLEGIDIRRYVECPFCAELEGAAGKPCMCGQLVDWVIIGGESGPGARSFDLAWAESLRDQCRAAGTAFFMKQAGSNCIWSVNGGTYYPKYKDRSGANPVEWPVALRMQQFPGGGK